VFFGLGTRPDPARGIHRRFDRLIVGPTRSPTLGDVSTRYTEVSVIRHRDSIEATEGNRRCLHPVSSG